MLIAICIVFGKHKDKRGDVGEKASNSLLSYILIKTSPPLKETSHRPRAWRATMVLRSMR